MCLYLCMLFLFRLYRSTVYIDAAHCYRPSSMVGLSVTVISPAEMAEPMEMPFGLWTRLGLRNHVLDKGLDCPVQMGNFWGTGYAGQLVIPRGGKCSPPLLALW